MEMAKLLARALERIEAMERQGCAAPTPAPDAAA